MKEGEIKTEARYTVEAYYNGFRILLTQPFVSGDAIVGLLNKMSGVGFTPKPNGELASPEKEPGKETEAQMCPVHGVEMKKFTKGSQSWFAHKDGDKWCNGKKK
jgi:hypothetical protein